MIRQWNLLLVVGLFAMGCDRALEQHEFELIQEDGYVIALTRGAPLYDSTPFRLVELTRVHEDPRVEASLLKDPGTFRPGPNGTLIVAERSIGRILVYDAEGEFIRQIGSIGSGPGQFQRVNSIQVIGDSLVFYDPGLHRLSIFDENGWLIETISTVEYGPYGTVNLLPQNLLAIYRTQGSKDSTYMTARVFRMETGETVASLRTGAVELADEGWTYGDPIPFNGVPIAQTVPCSRILMSSGREPEIDLYDVLGRLIRRIALDLPSRKVTADHVRRYWAGDDIRRTSQGVEPASPREKANKVFAESAGWWRGAVVDDSGYIWLQDAFTFYPSYQPTEFHVFDPEGRYLGMVKLPSEARASRTGIYIEGGLLYALVRDDSTGGLNPTVFRIEPAIAGLKYP